jgi:hypothetical protein
MSTQVSIDFPVGTPPGANELAMTPEERKVYRALGYGAENARQIPALASATGIGGRQVQSLVESLILDHHVPVGTSMSKPYGNYIIDTSEDLRATVQLLRDRGISNLVRAASLLGLEVKLYLARVQTEMEIEAIRKDEAA